MMYNNPENLSRHEITMKLFSLGYGINRNKRYYLLYSYATDLISKELWISKYCVN